MVNSLMILPLAALVWAPFSAPHFDGARAETKVASESSLAPLAAEDFDFDAARHLLMRAGFGGTAEQIRRLHALGLDGMVDRLVNYESLPDHFGPYAWRSEKVMPGRRELAKMSEDERRTVRRQVRQQDQRSLAALRGWWMNRILASERPLEERMTLFWHGHFTTSYRDVRASKLIAQQNALLRSHATGNFGDLLLDISRDPAMLAYLNNNQNRKGRPNENYAREVMELFTLGIGNYSEADIREVARAFTGWSFDRRSGRFIANRRQHDTGVKSIFGSAGRFDGVDVCELLLAHKASAPYIAGKIFSYFAHENPDAAIVDELAQLLRSRRFELKPLLRRMFKSRAFYSVRSRARQVKSPVVLVASTVRMLGMNPPPGALLARSAANLGQELFAPPNVRGWQGGLSWITTSSLLERDNACGVLLRAGLIQQVVNRRADRQAAQKKRAAKKKSNKNKAARAGQERAASRPTSRPTKEAEMRDVQSAREKRRDRAANSLMRSWEPKFSACAMARRLMLAQRSGTQDAVTVEALVDAFAANLLMVKLSASTRAEILVFAKGEDGSLPIRIGRLSGIDMERKLRELIHLLMSTPEFQVC